LSFSNENGELYALIISDLAGRKIASLQSNQTSMLLDATHFPKGVYLLHLQGKYQYQGKWVIQ
ncbi:MAG: T9SS type A sorting domain-containing protein, partial [Bacteroidia bacterium]